MKEKIVINLNRMQYLLHLFGMSEQDIINRVNASRKNKLKTTDLFSEEIDRPILKKIDEIFKQGLSFYTDPSNIEISEDSSIFFRKKSFNTPLNLGDRLIVNQTEKNIRYLSAISKLSNQEFAKRTLPRFTIKDNPEKVAYQIREQLYPKKDHSDDKAFLTQLIDNFASANILVLEFIETWNKKEKTSLDGFFISPNVISIKRQQGSFKREIFTLAHELGHYLINIEEIDQNNIDKYSNEQGLDKTEKWCDKFAFAFLTGQNLKNELLQFNHLVKFDNDKIKEISAKYHISRLAIFANLNPFNLGTLDWSAYLEIKKNLDDESKARRQKSREEKEQQKLWAKLSGAKQGSGSPKPIYSSLEQQIYRSAYFEGVIKEYDILSHFKFKDIDKFLYE